MSAQVRLAHASRVYVWSVIALGVVAVLVSAQELTLRPVKPEWLILAALTIVSGSATVKLPTIPASISISETFIFAAVLLYGPAAGTLTVAVDGLVISFWLARRKKKLYRALFNMSAPAVSVWSAAHIFFQVSGLRPLVEAPATLNQIFFPLFLFTIVNFNLNSWLIAIAVSFETGLPSYRVWRDNFIWLSLNYFFGASVALLLVTYSRTVDLGSIGVLIPILLALYFTFKISMERIEEANSHVKEVNKLYLSTVETLAMAIDAKDQVTHGHIRRVQRYAIGLATNIGVRDTSLLRAIEAAALLHDMGKLAVPEHILNKPGKLTPREFEKMKLHASVGAEILSAIDFPYPVVPIVRHHHESWDGSGYPDGLRGTDIPIGARILAVVDCFDALTSDRPYRPALSPERAIDILNHRRGNMYDPVVVDAFVLIHGTLEKEITSTTDVDTRLEGMIRQQASLTADSIGSSGPSPDRDSASHTPLAQPEDEAGLLVRQIADALPGAVCAYFSIDESSDEVVVTRAWGKGFETVLGMRHPIGQGLSGWVAANCRPIWNSDPSLDLSKTSLGQSGQMTQCSSIPLCKGELLLGVVAVYSPATEAFAAEHQQLLEFAASRFPERLARKAALVAK